MADRPRPSMPMLPVGRRMNCRMPNCSQLQQVSLKHQSRALQSTDSEIRKDQVMGLTPPGAAKEILRRRLIRGGLIEWGRSKGVEAAPHHQLICREIEAFLTSDDEMLLLFAPPGAAKSTWLSILFPAYYLARLPGHGILG